jgi:DNA-binding CsgD family transcriptional regulator
MYALAPQLTKREREVLSLVASGHTDRKIAEVLVISRRTVNRHMSNIFLKLAVPSRAAAAVYAIRCGFVQQEFHLLEADVDTKVH